MDRAFFPVGGDGLDHAHGEADDAARQGAHQGDDHGDPGAP